MEHALSLPPGIFHDAGIYDLEKDRLFHKGWVCVGRTAEMPRAGDFISYDILDQPVFVIRQQDGSVKAFPNVCLHRCARLVEGNGHVRKVSCPYHSWTYELDGQLIGAPFMQKTADFKVSNYRLDPLPCEIWHGFIYVSLNRSAMPLSNQLNELDEHIADFRVADYVPVYEEHEVWDTNWKCLVENFMDVYHLHRVHADSFGKYGSFEHSTEMFPGNDAYSWMIVQEDGSENSVAAHPDNTWLKGDKRHQTVLFNMFPSHVIQLQPDLLWYLSIMPEGHDKVRIKWAVSIAKEYLDTAADRAAHIKEELDLLMQVNGEDKGIVENVFRATKMHGATRGPLSWLERSCWDFGRYLARELAD